MAQQQNLSVVEQYKRAIEQAESIRQAAVDELRKKIQGHLDELKSFEVHYYLAKGEPTRKSRKTSDPATRHCAICDMEGHDARHHRGQAKKKKFTPAELAAMGLPGKESAAPAKTITAAGA